MVVEAVCWTSPERQSKLQKTSLDCVAGSGRVKLPPTHRLLVLVIASLCIVSASVVPGRNTNAPNRH